jgi:putative tricarboxylic transport membrane protein
MQKEERLAAAALFAVGAWSVYEAYWQIGFGSFQSPGPGFIPFWLAAILCAVSVCYFVVASDGVNQKIWISKSWLRPVLSGAVMLAYALLFDTLGFCLATALMYFAWLRLIEKESLRKSVCVSLFGTFGAYALFVLLLDVGLPSGSLWQ